MPAATLPRLAAAFLLAAIACACGGGDDGGDATPAASTPGAAAGAAAGAITLAETPPAAPPTIDELDVEGLRERLARSRGRVLVVNVWASWCSPCGTEFGELDLFARDYRDRGVEVLAVSVDDPAARNTAVARFLAAHPASFALALKAAGDAAPFRALFDPRWDGSLPSTFVLDRDGRVHARLLGAHRREDFEQAVAPLVGSPRPRLSP